MLKNEWRRLACVWLVQPAAALPVSVRAQRSEGRGAHDNCGRMPPPCCEGGAAPIERLGAEWAEQRRAVGLASAALRRRSAAQSSSSRVDVTCACCHAASAMPRATQRDHHAQLTRTHMHQPHRPRSPPVG